MVELMAVLEAGVLETPRLRLRPMEAGDEAMFCHLYTDPDVMRRILPPLSSEAATQSFRRACAHNAKDAPGHRFWAIDHKAVEDVQSASAIGMAALLRSGDRAELGVMLRHGWWNRGISSEAFVPLIDHAFLGMGLALVYAERPDDDHARIIDRLLDRFGFVHAPERATAPSQCRWELPRATWAARRESTP
ncbi:GNAT family N-acetyltransferase [Lysobacter solisilvae (ex Woo and Kim 2020)]|uniref:GNAT family N-acetyltransferase n=1 Tax=Agrilutibacter terrestris TaxID=2865112 RepID=A0A7H0FTX3_9GAMM|nr:GNAT family N-acetyltransferase [Lysobacter terrestris]QNP39489.1 GNAT family N-acetyltransferase [Lysobacter terrestris]